MTVPSTKLNKDRPMPAAVILLIYLFILIFFLKFFQFFNCIQPDRDFGEGKILWLQFKSLMAKSLRIQGRQYVTNTVQV